MQEEYLSVAQVAKLKGISRNAVYNAVKEGRLPYEHIVGVAIRRADAEAWEPKAHRGRRQGTRASEESKARISVSQKARWRKRKGELEAQGEAITQGEIEAELGNDTEAN